MCSHSCTEGQRPNCPVFPPNWRSASDMFSSRGASVTGRIAKTCCLKSDQRFITHTNTHQTAEVITRIIIRYNSFSIIGYIAYHGSMKIDNELERNRKEMVMPSSTNYPGIYEEELRKTTKKLSHVSRCLCRDLNLEFPEWKSTGIPVAQPLR